MDRRTTHVTVAGILAILHSRIASFYFDFVCVALEGSRDRYVEFRAQYVDQFPGPSRLRDFDDRTRLVGLADLMLSLCIQLEAGKTPTDKTAIQREIDATDRPIDDLVYELYNLTEDYLHAVIGVESTTLLSAVQASECLRRLSGGEPAGVGGQIGPFSMKVGKHSGKRRVPVVVSRSGTVTCGLPAPA